MSQQGTDPPQPPKDPWEHKEYRSEENASGKLFSAAQEGIVKRTEPREDIKEVIKNVDELFPSSGDNAGGDNEGGNESGNGGQ